MSVKNKSKTIFIAAFVLFIICIGYSFYTQQRFLVNQLIASLGNHDRIETILFHGASIEQIQIGLNVLNQQGYGEIGHIYLNHLLIEQMPMILLFISSIIFILTVYLLYIYQKKNQQKEIELIIQFTRNEIAFGDVKCNEAFILLKETIAEEKKTQCQQLNEYQIMNEVQLDYLENITHQIKTPLTSLILLIDMCKTANKETAQSYLLEAEEICQKIDEITSLLLKAGQLRSNQKNLHFTRLNMNELIAECLNQTATKYPKINFKLHAEKEYFLWADSAWLKEAFINILDNSSRYSPEYSNVQITLNNTIDKLQIIIEDEGCGIDDAELDTIFNRYHQHNQTKGHFGIGLHLAKEIIQAHCGQIKAYNKQSKGTCFEISLVLLQGERVYNNKS